MESDLSDIVPTRAQLLNKNKITDFKATVFESYKPKQKNEQWKDFKRKIVNDDNEDHDDDEEDNHMRRRPSKRKHDDTEFDIKTARTEVMKFAVSGGYRKERNKKKAEIAMSVRLGGKPPKRPHRNYKELLEEKARTKKLQAERAKFYQLGKNKTGSSTVKCRNKKKNKRPVVGGISQSYGVVNPKLKKKKK